MLHDLPDLVLPEVVLPLGRLLEPLEVLLELLVVPAEGVDLVLAVLVRVQEADLMFRKKKFRLNLSIF